MLIKNTEYKKENGKYLIFIYDDYAKDELSRSYPVFRVKITKDKKLPQTKEELENLEYVITRVKTVEWELMLSTKDKHQEIIDLQDEWGYLYDYKIKIYTTYKSKPAEDLIYLGNFQLTLPKREYFPYPCNIELHLWDNILERVLQKYHFKCTLPDQFFRKGWLTCLRKESYRVLTSKTAESSKASTL